MTPTAAESVPPTNLVRAAFYLTWACAVSVLFSIAVSQSLLALAFAALLLAEIKLRVPRVWLPLVLFMAATVVSLLLSGDMRVGLPQIRKFYVYLVLVIVFSMFRTLTDVRKLVLSWAAAGGLAAALGLVQFVRKIHEAHQQGRSFYEYYVASRITGFTSNWQTFGGEQMIVLLMLAAFLMFSPRARGRVLWLGLFAAGLLAAALLLGWTRGVWLATACAGLYLVWCWNRRVLLGIPVLLALVLWLDLGSVRTRFQSGYEPGKSDSNQHRIVCWRTGWEMIRAHPWFGVGPERVGPRLMEFVPRDIPRPLPEGWYGHLHSIYIHYAAERGVPAMLALVWLLLMFLWDCLRALRRLPAGRSERKAILHGAVAVVVAIMIAGIFELNLGDSEVLAMFLAVVACGYVAVSGSDPEEPAVA